MRRFEIYIIIAILIAIAALAAYQYIFSIYEVVISVEPKELYADNQSTVTISVVPLNSMGWEAPFRYGASKFEIQEGKELVEILSEDDKKGFIVIKAKNTPGKVVVLVKPENALLPSSVEIIIKGNVV